MPNSSAITIAIAMRIPVDVYEIVTGRVLKKLYKEKELGLKESRFLGSKELRRLVVNYFKARIIYDTRRQHG